MTMYVLDPHIWGNRGIVVNGVDLHPVLWFSHLLSGYAFVLIDVAETQALLKNYFAMCSQDNFGLQK